MTNHIPPARPGYGRTVLVVLGVVTTVTLLGYVWLTRFPNAFDREQVNAELVADLQAAGLPRETAIVRDAWPQWRGPNRDGLAAPQPLRTNWAERPPELIWSVPCGGGYSSVVVVEGRAYVTDYDGQHERVLCVAAATGQQLWTHSIPADYSALRMGYAAGPRATVTVHEGRLYFLGATGQFVALQLPPADAPLPTGPTELWRHDLLADFDAELPAWGLASSPLIDGEAVIVQPGGRRGTVAAFHRLTGAVLWTAGRGPTGYSSPVATTFRGRRLIVALTARELLILAAADGQILARHPWPVQQGITIPTPIVLDDYIFISSGYTKGAALLKLDLLANGQPTNDTGPNNTEQVILRTVYFRPNKLMRNHHSTCVHKDGYLYGFDNATLTCIDLRQGTPAWDTPSVGKGSLIRCGDYLLGLSERGQLFLAEANPTEFVLLGRHHALDGGECWAIPTLVDGRVYLRNATRLSCWDVRP